MRFSDLAPPPSALLLVSVLAVAATTTDAQTMTTIVPGARTLTIEECTTMVATEIDEEFEYSDVNPVVASIASRLWDAANAYEWKKAAEAEFASGQMYPYLLCHVGEGLSGHQRIIELAASLGLETEEEIEEKKTHFRALYNEEEFFCAYGQLLASDAAGITGDEFVVQPVLPSLKFMKGSVKGMTDEMNFANMDENVEAANPSLDVNLCPGVSKAQEGAAETAAQAVSEGWEEVSEETAGEIIEALMPTTIASKLANSVKSAYYLTSDEYLDSDEELTGRSKMWNEMIEDYQETEKCHEVYRERLTWRLQRARPDHPTDVSHLNVEFDASSGSEDAETDVGCVLSLSLAIAGHPDVCSLEVRGRVGVENKVTQWLVQSEIEGRRPAFDAGLDGTGQVVTVSDTGVDQDNCYFVDPDGRPGEFTPNMNARKIAQYVSFVDDGDYEYGHGTHVAGTIAGKRIDGPGMADGVAPGAKLAVADIGDATGALSLPLDSRLLDVGTPRAKIHSASWGSQLNFYTTQARNFDQAMYDDDEFLIVIAAGNSGHGDAPNTVGSPATGKNIIAVGAHHNTASSTPRLGLGPSYVADFSSRGPTSDGRTKPDIMAPGKAVLSAGALPRQVGECDPPKNPGANGKAEGVLSIQGTSMATPVVSGTAAIVRQYFEQGYYPTGKKNETIYLPNPSGALIKAVLMNGAQFLKGVDNGGNGVTEIKPYDNNQGFGRLALQHSIYLPGKTNVQLSAWDRKAVQDQSFDTYEVRIDKSDGCAYDKLSVTLVWVEPGSTPGCMNCVLNDLDLSVEMGGQTYYPNGKNGPDRLNSAERVVIGGVNNGDIATIKVTGHNLIVPAQKYSLVATGCFGGVANQNFDDQCSVFVCDDSQDKRIQTILMAVFIPLGVICLCGIGVFFKRRKDQATSEAVVY